ncbi:hypothetical protein DTO027I6_8323 [Penicillium roqueforti]|nr:hypothetical protein CBS147337_7103 [Penicillium roqueforti]KAI2704767.1 hypothetical protein CBS147332_7421 [Penicillium roqueforti]KAI2728975.1 hypothetical protein CBS147354_2222 [Penicillium roqueforti]KAI3097729.1 hypothetical protein CBS147331_8926 [Penicillium roqueforti]KAI3108638.1 hypothetical protein CBS147333_5916 [Penicillium roqueforti]
MAYYEDRYRDRYARPTSYADPYDEPRGHYRRHERDSYVPRASNDSVEEIQRDYPPGSDYTYERSYDSRRSRRPVYENVRRASSVGAYDAPYRSSGPRRPRHYEDERSRRSRYDSDSSSPSRSPPRNRRRKSFSDQALGAIGLGGAAASSSRGDRGRSRSQSRHHHRSYSRSPSDSRSRHRGGSSKRDKSTQRIAQAARAALTAGAVEAFKQRKEPGEWAGAKGKRVLTAAVAAAGTDGLVDRDPSKHGTRHVLESTLAGLAASHFVGGGSRSRSRSRGRDHSSGGGLKNLAATGALAAAGKEIYDRYSKSHSKSRSRHRGRSDSRGSDEDDRGSHKRSKSVSDYIGQGMAALGLGGEQEERRRDSGDDRKEHREHRREHRDDRERRHRRGHRDDDYSDSDAESDYYNRDSRRGKGSRDVGRYRSSDGRNPPPCARTSASRGAGSKDRGNSSSSESDSDLGDSSDEKKQRKKLKRDMLVTGGLASVATIHAAHSVYTSIEKRKERLKQLQEGEITPEEARKRRMTANAKDALSIGLAALGIKGAYGEWKELMEKRKENTHFQEECAERAIKRERRRAHSQGPPSRRHRWPDEIEYAPSTADSRNDHTPLYRDGNPYRVHEAPQISY